VPDAEGCGDGEATSVSDFVSRGLTGTYGGRELVFGIVRMEEASVVGDVEPRHLLDRATVSFISGLRFLTPGTATIG
jgi:hypothetical protein